MRSGLPPERTGSSDSASALPNLRAASILGDVGWSFFAQRFAPLDPLVADVVHRLLDPYVVRREPEFDCVSVRMDGVDEPAAPDVVVYGYFDDPSSLMYDPARWIGGVRSSRDSR